MRIGVDLGGTKIELIALDAAGSEIFRKRTPTPQGDYAATVRMVSDLILDFESQGKEQATVGIGIPGALSRVTGLVKNANSTCLIGHDLKGDLEQALGREIRVANDANCFALSEAVDGAGKGAEVVFGVILGTGVGAGIVVRGEVLTGPNAIAGEWGHNPLPLPRKEDLPLPDCYCGRKGCIEAYLSGPALLRDGENLERYEERLARSLAGVINVLDPEVIVLGGEYPTSSGCMPTCRCCGNRTSSRIMWRRGWCRRCMGIPAACAARHGSGDAECKLRKEIE